MIALIIAGLRLITHRFVILSAIAATFGIVFLVYYFVGSPGWEIDSVPTGLATVFFGIGAITYAKYPEGVLEHNKRVLAYSTLARQDEGTPRTAPTPANRRPTSRRDGLPGRSAAMSLLEASASR